MTMNLKEILIPEYLKEFKCIGGECEDTCCAGWYISIDEDTYKKYKKIKDYKMKLKINKNITRNRSNPTKNNVAKMKLKDSNCTFLTDKGWCEIHSNLGEEYLCKTCTIYPRTTNKVNNVIEKSLTLSCPEAARKILLNKKGIQFEQNYEKKLDELLINREIHTNSEGVKTWKDYFWELRIFTISLIQNKNYTLEEGLIILGLFLNNVNECLETNNIEDINRVIGQYMNYVESGVLKDNINKIPNSIELQLRLCKELVDIRFSNLVSSTRYIECLKQTLIGLNFKEGVKLEENKEKYIEAFNKYYSPFIDENRHILENYLVNYVFKNCMPLDSDNLFKSYAKMVIDFSLIKLHLIGVSGYNKGLTEEQVVMAIQLISKTFEHNREYFNKIMKLVKKNGYMNLASMAILIKN